MAEGIVRTLKPAHVCVKVNWYDDAKTILHFTIAGPKGGHKAGFFVRLEDLLSELSRLGIWEQLGIPVRREGGDDDV